MTAVLPARESDVVLSTLDDGLARLRRRDMPYAHAVAEDLFDKTLVRQVVQLFACDMRWEPADAAFYHYSVGSNVVECLSSSPAAWLIGRRAQEIMRTHLERTFARRLTSSVQFAAHRMAQGDWIGTHNDLPATHGSLSHRLVFMFSSTEASIGGGELVLMRFHPMGLMRDEVVVGGHNGAVAMQCSSHSFHRLGRVYEGVRYSLVASFCTRDAMKEGTRDLAG